MEAQRQKVLQLDQERLQIEQELSELETYLTAPGMPGLKGGLVDQEGFPVQNIDHWDVVRKRQRYNMLNNDHVAIMKEIEQEMYNFFGYTQNQPPTIQSQQVAIQQSPLFVQVQPNQQQSQEQPTQQQQQQQQQEQQEQQQSQFKPFAYISEVTQSSPAQLDGIQLNDQIISVGTAANMEDLANFVRLNIGKEISVKVLRENQLCEVKLTPRKWEGQGVLGCRFTPKK